MVNDITGGMHYFMRGVKMLNHPALRHYVIIPLMINIVLFACLLALGIHWYGEFVAWIDHMLPSWLQWLNWLLWLLFVMAGLIILIYCFTFAANLVASPFNGLLAEKVEKLVTSKPSLGDEGWFALLREIPTSIKRSLRMFFYYLPRAIFFLILFFVPIIQLAAGPLWILFNSWMMSVQYINYPMENHKIPFKTLTHDLRQKPALTLGFGSVVMFASMIPVVNFVVMPAAVIGATILWVERGHS